MHVDDDFALNQIAAAVMTVAGYVPLSVRYEAAKAALAVVDEYFATGCVVPGCEHRRSNRGYDMQQFDGFRRLDPDAPAPPLEGGDWGFVDDLDDGHVGEPGGDSDGAE